MENIPDNRELELLCFIVNFGLGSKVIKAAKQNGVSGGTVFLGKGTVKNHILELLDLCDIRKEVVLMISEKTTAYSALEKINKDFNLSKANHGIAFTVPVMNIIGARSYRNNNVKECRGAENTMYKSIFVIVDKGRAENAIEAATKAGSRGGTIINARGSGIHETNKLFSMEIEPEKEIVLILSESDKTEPILSSIKEELQLDVPGNGFMFVLDVNQTYGLY